MKLMSKVEEKIWDEIKGDEEAKREFQRFLEFLDLQDSRHGLYYSHSGNCGRLPRFVPRD